MFGLCEEVLPGPQQRFHLRRLMIGEVSHRVQDELVKLALLSQKDGLCTELEIP